METLQLLIDLHKRAERQGPGGNAETEKALNLATVDRLKRLKVADIGCGTGASTLALARLLNVQITAVDFLPEFLDVLAKRADDAGLSEKITTLCCSMDQLPFENETYDMIWSEGAIYNIGFEKGITEWKRYLKAGGWLIVSEITWITPSRPTEVQAYWEREYPQIDTASSKIRVLEKNGFSPMGYFVLPEHCWLDNYYYPIQNGLQDFLERNGHSEEAHALATAETQEIELYKKYKTYYSYGVYIAQKQGE